MNRKEKYAEMERAYSARIASLKTVNFTELCQLPEYSHAVHKIGKWEYSISTYFKKLAQNKAQIVVQAYHHAFLGIGTMWADGFIMTDKGETTPLPDETRWEYC
jgi:hypothetical protein